MGANEMRPDSVRVAFGYNVHVIDIARRRACVLDRQTCWEVSGAPCKPASTSTDARARALVPYDELALTVSSRTGGAAAGPVVDDVRSASAAPATACRRCSRARASMPTAPLLPAGTGRRATCSAARGSECPMPAEGLEAQHLPTRRRSRAAESLAYTRGNAPL
jgi:hypothetical protein